MEKFEMIDMQELPLTKGHYETVEEKFDEVSVYDEKRNFTGIQRVWKGARVKWVWDDPEEIKKELREKRKPLLNAFDKWEKGVLRGREQDKEFIMEWYYDLLDLKEYAFENIPKQIKYYM